MNVVIQKYQQLEKTLGDYLANLTQNPPMGMGSFLKPLNQSFQMCRILGNQMQAQDRRIAELESRLDQIPSTGSVTQGGAWTCSKCGNRLHSNIACGCQQEAANDE